MEINNFAFRPVSKDIKTNRSRAFLPDASWVNFSRGMGETREGGGREA